ncbi:amino acid adenylation domain-containing protein [Streptomyces sp. NPDC004009]
MPSCSAVVRGELGLAAKELGDDWPRLLLAGWATLLYRCTGLPRIGLLRTDDTGRTSPVGVTVDPDAPLRAQAATAVDTADAGAATVGIRIARTAGAAPESRGCELELVVAEEQDGSLTTTLHHDPRLFDEVTAARWLDHLRTLVSDAVTHPDRPVSRLRLLTEAQARRTLVEWNTTEAELPHDVCLHEAFEAHARRAPDAVAVVHGGERWTYRRVDEDANRLARRLRSLGVGPDVRVGLCLDRSPGLLTALLGVLKAGGAYVPLDPAYPAARIETMVGGASCAVMISRVDLAGNLPAAGAGTPLVLLDRDAEALAALSPAPVAATAGPENLCYIIHTSGSTGTPKPIALRHRGVVNNIADLNSRFGVGPEDSVLALSSPSFDMSVYEFLGLTAAGGTVVVPDRNRVQDPAHWAELIVSEDVTVWNSAPALLGLLADHLEQTGTGPLSSLRLALLGGDWVPVPLPDRIRIHAPGLRFVVMGGATEASIHSTLYEVERVDPAWNSIPYGRPMANQRTYILDERLQPVPPGVPGELFLAGIGLARGYLDQPERTAERFLDWSWDEIVRERLYRTGDLARYGADGMIELLGRTDFQVKINGLRVELGEIEALLRSVPGVRQTAVAAVDGRLVGYVVPEESGAAGEDREEELRALVAARLPEYMVPHAVMTLEALPLTPNGKLDRRALPAPQRAGAAYRAPATTEETAVAAIFADVLGLDRVGLDDDFLALGGDSIGAIRVVTRAGARGLRLTARQVLQCRTVAALAEVATAVAGSAADDGAARREPLLDADARDVEQWRRAHPGLAGIWPLTPMQSGMLFDSVLRETGEDPCHLQTLYRLSGRIDAEALRGGAQALLDRHASLRAAFVRDSADRQVSIVVDGLELPWRVVDCGELEGTGREEALRRFLAEDRAERFDLTAPPLVRMALLRFGTGSAVLVLSAHHALLDGWSEQVLAGDLVRLCAAGGDGVALPAPRGFEDFLGWLSGRDQEAAARAWRDELAGVEGPTLLAPAARPDAPAAGTGEVVLPLETGRPGGLAQAVARLGVTANTLVQGAWAVLLSALTGQPDVVFGATVSGRPGSLAGVESMVGLFINTVPVRVRCEPRQPVARLLAELQERQTSLLDHHHRGLTDVHRDAGLSALFDTLVVFQSYPADRPGAEAVAAAGFEVTGVDSVGDVSYPLALFVEPGRLVVQYHRDRFDRRSAELIADRFRAVLDQVVAEPHRPVGTVDVVLPTEAAGLTGPAPDTSGSGTTVADLFARHAAGRPNAVAVTDGGSALTYRQLDERSARLAARLARRGIGPGSAVSPALPASVALPVALLAVLRTGAACAFSGSTASGPAFFPVTRADVDAVADPAAADGDPLPRPERPTAGQPVWIGSGQAVGEAGLAQGTKSLIRALKTAPGDRVLVTAADAEALAARVLAGLCGGQEVTIGTGEPAAWAGWRGEVILADAEPLADALEGAASGVRTGAVVGFGPPDGSVLTRLRAALPRARLVTVYGPSPVLPALVGDATAAGPVAMPLGTPVDGVRARVLSPSLRLLPEGVTGELHLTGVPELGRPGDAAMTALRSVADPYGPPGSRMYRTRARVRWSAPGVLEYVGDEGQQPAPPLPGGSVEAAADDTGAEVSPREAAMCALFAEVLGVERVSVHDRFFDIGVNSLMAGRLVSRMRRTLGLTVSIRTVFEHPTIAQLARQAGTGTPRSRPGLRRMSR